MEKQRLRPTGLRFGVLVAALVFVAFLLIVRMEERGRTPEITHYDLYDIDETAYVYDGELDLEGFLAMDFRLGPATAEGPRVLIFHTHSQEAFADSRPEVWEDSIVGMGALLAEALEAQGLPALHYRGVHDVVAGELHREGSYERIAPSLQALLEAHPTLEVTLDLHRDATPEGVPMRINIAGRPTARIMFFNGISRLKQDGQPVDLTDLPNPHQRENLAFSLQMQLAAQRLHPGFARNLYIKSHRYNLHLLPRALLVELGADTNTVAEAQNAITPLAQVLGYVLRP